MFLLLKRRANRKCTLHSQPQTLSLLGSRWPIRKTAHNQLNHTLVNTNKLQKNSQVKSLNRQKDGQTGNWTPDLSQADPSHVPEIELKMLRENHTTRPFAQLLWCLTGSMPKLAHPHRTRLCWYRFGWMLHAHDSELQEKSFVYLYS